jgi:hypothetical protein
MNTTKNIRTRNFSLVTYVSMADIENYCKLPHVKNYAYILHDKDIKEDGSLKEPHIHVVLSYHNARTRSAVLADFKDFSQNTLVEECIELEGCLDYLTHKRNPDKFQYPVDCVKTNFGYYRGDYTTEDNTAYCLVMDIMKGLSRLQLLRKYGRDFAINRDKYYGLATEIAQEEEYEYLDEETLQDCENRCHRSKRRPFLVVEGTTDIFDNKE